MSGLGQEVEHLALVVDGPPQPISSITDPDDHLIDVPAIAGARTAASKVPGNHAPELEKPPPDRLIRNVDAALRQQILDIAGRQREPGTEPDACMMISGGKRCRLNIIGVISRAYRSLPATFTDLRCRCRSADEEILARSCTHQSGDCAASLLIGQARRNSSTAEAFQLI